MAELETLQEAKVEGAETSGTDLLVAFPALGSNVPEPIVAKLASACGQLATPCQATLAIPSDQPVETQEIAGGASPLLPVVSYPPSPAEAGTIPWVANAAAYRTICAVAENLGARACTVLGASVGYDLESFTAERLALLLDPAIEGNFDLVMPLYTSEAFDDLVNKSILYPLTRALYGFRIRNPLGNEFQISAKMFPAVSGSGQKDAARLQGKLPWLGTIAASRGLKICQVRLGNRRPSSADGIELSDALAQLAGPLFVDMEENAAFWQRIRGSHEVPSFGSPETAEDAPDTIDVRRMVDAFQLGERNLRDVWSLILPPVTLLELKKLARLAADDFRMEDSLWARIIYDFALAHRLRNIHRGHLFGALTPLYLGWVASYAAAINRSGVTAAEERVEQLARAYETEKPYLLSRWRWPDRFHP